MGALDPSSKPAVYAEMMCKPGAVHGHRNIAIKEVL